MCNMLLNLDFKQKYLAMLGMITFSPTNLKDQY